MDECHYYLSNGLWKIVPIYFDPGKQVENDYFWAMAILPNYHSFGSHIISTPWQQSWMVMNILEGSNQILEGSEDGNDAVGISLLNVLRKEVDFQYTLRNYSSDSFVQKLFNIYSKIQTHLLVNFSEAETKAFTSELKSFFKVLLKQNPSTAHTLLMQMLQHGFFVSCWENLLLEVEDDELLCNSIVSSFCKTETIQFYSPAVVKLLQTPFRSELCLLLLATDNVNILQSMIEEDKRLFKCNSRSRLQSLMDHGLRPVSCFSDMTLMGRHFVLQLLDMMNSHLDEFSILLKCQNIPSFIWPMVLLENWNNCFLSDELLLELIEKCKESTKDKMITQITYILEWHINFCKWYEKHETTDKKESNKSESKENLLKKAKEHSVLYLINNTTDLSETDWSQIRELLKQDKSKGDTMKSWDVILFDGYCVMMLVLQTIVVSSEIEHVARSQKVKLEDVEAMNETFSSLYREEITNNLEKVKSMLRSLYPLSFRLEILENVFALIFVTYDEVRKLSYFSNGSLDFEKHVGGTQLKKKPSDKSNGDCSLEKNFSVPGTLLRIFKNPEEDEVSRKMKLKGFVCKKYIVRDLIYLVKECLEEIEQDPGTQSDENQIDVPCSIKPVQMENRLDRLLESVSEATWRLQLVTDPDFVSQIGSMRFACGQDPNDHFDGEWMYLSNEADRVGLMKSRKKSTEKPAESAGSQSNSSVGNGNCNVESQNAKQQQQHHGKPHSGPAIMNQMLACDSSLVVQCLSQSDVLNADHIIQMMNTEENRQNLEGELNFTRAINDLKKKLQNISMDSPVRKSGIDSVSKSRSLQSIQLIANQGVNSTALTNHVERFLSAYTLPSIQSHSKVSAGSVLQCIENTTAMVTIDLALTTAVSFQDFKDLLNIASKYCPELNTRVQSPISAQTTFTKPLGYIVFSQNMIALLQEINRNQIVETDSEISPQKFLRSHQHPLSLKSLKDNVNFWKHLNSAFADFDRNVEESKALTDCKEGLLARCQKNIKDTQNIFESVTKLAESCTEFMDLGKLDASGGGEPSKNVNYCDLLSKYLSDLSVFVLENVSSKAEDISEPITLHNLLEKSAVEIVDKLIFEYHVEPGVLEKKAQQLGFNLSASLIAGCCPRLPQTVSPNAEISKCLPSDRIVLNELFPVRFPDYESLPASDPNEVVGSILTELSIAFRTYARNKQCDGDSESADSARNVLTAEDITELRSDIKIQRILEKTSELNFVQLKSLDESETLAFFASLLNLMICHCYLSTKLDETDGVYSRHSFFREVGFFFLGYNLGELGFVSIFDVKQKIYGENYGTGFSPRSTEKWTNVRVRPDPRLIFATIDFRSTSPPFILIESTANRESLIEEVIVNYIRCAVTVAEEGELVVTDLLDTYLKKVILKGDPGHVTGEGMESILTFLRDHSSGELGETLTRLSPSSAKLRVNRCRDEIMLRLDYEVIVHPTVQSARESTEEKWLKRTLSDSIIRHLGQSSRILADVVQKIHECKEPDQTEVARDVLTEEKLKYLDLLFGSPWLQQCSPLFRGNAVVAGLRNRPEESDTVAFFEDCVSRGDWTKCLDVIFALNDHFVFSDLNVKRFKDVALREAAIVASRQGQHHSWCYCEHISDVNIRIETVTSCCRAWPGSVCRSQLSSILRDNPSLPSEKRKEIEGLAKKIAVYGRILEAAPDLDAKNWFDVSAIANDSPRVIIKCLAKHNQLELCLQWITLPEVLSSVQELIDSDLVFPFFENLSQEVDSLDLIADSLPADKLMEIYDGVIFRLTSVHSISRLVRKAIELDPSSTRYRLVEISLKFLLELDPEEQSRLVHLMSSPLLIIEQLLMNVKLDALEKVLKTARRIADDGLIDQEGIDKLIVTYASKAVEIDLVKTDRNSDPKQSFLIGATNQVSQEHVMPSEVPERSQWVPDDTVSLCMCCRLVSFSMFNRRHHCRRCGKVVCGTCSTRRMKVAGFRGVAVRVCQNCYLHQTKIDADAKCSQSTDTFDSSIFTQDFRQQWKLSTDPARNATIRDEFIYEHSPNATLCLALFNLLPDASRYPGILLEISERMIKLVQLNGKSGNPEVDFGVVIQIIRSLIVGAKVKHARAGTTSGMDDCDQLLSQVDLLRLLIDNHCSGLIPSEPLNGITLRCLRDKLVEEELWELAMEVSTKCGLEKNGVWAAWGKVCLAAGSWEEARIKFSHCLTPSPKPARNPPLLDEICRMLESPRPRLNVNVKSKMNEKDGGIVAEEVSQVLSTLKILSQGKSISICATSVKNSVQYEEEIFYLTTYGSHQSLLSFYLKQDELKKALDHLLQQQLDSDLFLECLLLPSYRTDQHEKFKSALYSADPSLESFKKHLSHSCLFLQKAGYLNTLHDLQVFMEDHVRAAATCVRLYRKNATTYGELVSGSSHLHSALRHFEEELAVLQKKTKRLDSVMKMDPKKISHHVNTIWRQLEVAKFLASCESDGKIVAKSIFSEETSDETELPTLFDGDSQRSFLVKMILLLGKNVTEGFGIAFRIMQDHQLDLEGICISVGRKLAEESRVNDVAALVDCLKTSGEETEMNSTVDAIVSNAITLLKEREVPLETLEPLSKLVKNIDLRINAFIETNQFLPAYMLAIKHNRLKDVERMMEAAEKQGRTLFKKICQTKLNQSGCGKGDQEDRQQSNRD